MAAEAARSPATLRRRPPRSPSPRRARGNPVECVRDEPLEAAGDTRTSGEGSAFPENSLTPGVGLRSVRSAKDAKNGTGRTSREHPATGARRGATGRRPGSSRSVSGSSGPGAGGTVEPDDRVSRPEDGSGGGCAPRGTAPPWEWSTEGYGPRGVGRRKPDGYWGQLFSGPFTRPTIRLPDHPRRCRTPSVRSTRGGRSRTPARRRSPLRRSSQRAAVTRRRAPRHPRRRRVGQDPRPDPAHRVAGPHRSGRRRPHAGRHLHPQGRGRAQRRLRPLGVAASPPARSTRSRSASCAAAPPTGPRRCRGSSSARPGSSVPIVGGRGPRRGWPRPRSRRDRVGQGPAVRPTTTPRRARAGRDTARGRHARSPTLYERYEREKRRRRVVDFDDLIWWCADALEDDAEFAAAQRWRFRHLFVDEFQDVSPAQLRLLRGWLGERNDLCVVGDPDQAIYSFTGADPTLLTGFAPPLPRRATSCGWTCNYRSTPEVVAVGRGGARRRRAPPPGARARSARRARPPVVTDYDSDDEEAAGVADRLRDCARPRCRLVVARGPLPHERAVGRVRGGAHRSRRSRSGSAATAGSSTVPRCRPRSRCCGAAASTPRRGPSPTTSATSRRRRRARQRRRAAQEHVAAVARLGREYLVIDGADGSVDGFVAYLDTALRDDAPDAPATPSSCSRSTAPRASSSTPCS